MTMYLGPIRPKFKRFPLIERHACGVQILGRLYVMRPPGTPIRVGVVMLFEGRPSALAVSVDNGPRQLLRADP